MKCWVSSETRLAKFQANWSHPQGVNGRSRFLSFFVSEMFGSEMFGSEVPGSEIPGSEISGLEMPGVACAWLGIKTSAHVGGV